MNQRPLGYEEKTRRDSTQAQPTRVETSGCCATHPQLHPTPLRSHSFTVRAHRRRSPLGPLSPRSDEATDLLHQVVPLFEAEERAVLPELNCCARLNPVARPDRYARPILTFTNDQRGEVVIPFPAIPFRSFGVERGNVDDFVSTPRRFVWASLGRAPFSEQADRLVTAPVAASKLLVPLVKDEVGLTHRAFVTIVAGGGVERHGRTVAHTRPSGGRRSRRRTFSISLSPARFALSKACSSPLRAVPSFSTKSANCRSRCRPSCCGFSRKKKCGRSAVTTV